VILLRDAQATGGYAKIAVVARVEMDRLGQMMPGDTIRFQRVDRQTALNLLRKKTQRLNEIRDMLK
jgi:allophanate hydrolase subunit 2